eukprot:617928-Prymnesium_polylepis.1
MARARSSFTCLGRRRSSRFLVSNTATSQRMVASSFSALAGVTSHPSSYVSEPPLMPTRSGTATPTTSNEAMRSARPAVSSSRPLGRSLSAWRPVRLWSLRRPWSSLQLHVFALIMAAFLPSDDITPPAQAAMKAFLELFLLRGREVVTFGEAFGEPSSLRMLPSNRLDGATRGPLAKGRFFARSRLVD